MSTESYDLDLVSETDAIVVQAASDRELAGQLIKPGERVTLAGRDFRVAEKVGLMPLLKFSHAAGLSTQDERAYVAMYQILRDVIRGADPPCGQCEACMAADEPIGPNVCLVSDKGDWDAFEEWAVVCKADADALLDVVSDAIKVISARPTESPSGSSRTSQRNSRKSTDGSSSSRAGGSGTSRRGRRAT